jgi:hypothetical protein
MRFNANIANGKDCILMSHSSILSQHIELVHLCTAVGRLREKGGGDTSRRVTREGEKGTMCTMGRFQLEIVYNIYDVALQ